MSRHSPQPKAQFVFGNHGIVPAQVEDFFELVRDVLSFSVGLDITLAQTPVPGSINFLLEYFDSPFVQALHEIKEKDPSTVFICIATEFATGSSFNDFDPVAPSPATAPRERSILGKRAKKALSAMHRHTPDFLRRLAWTVSPGAYSAAKSSVYGKPRTPTIRDYWNERFAHFKRALEVIDQVWIVTEDQRAGFASFVDPRKLWLFPTIPYRTDGGKSVGAASAERDIDFLFTGALSAYRNDFFDRLRAEGYRVVTGPSDLPAFIRNDYLSRARICLDVRQHANWAFASVMRLNHLLIRGKFTVSERSKTQCPQYEFVQLAEPSVLLDTCLDAIRRPDLDDLGLERRAAYIKATQEKRRVVKEDLIARLTPHL